MSYIKYNLNDYYGAEESPVGAFTTDIKNRINTSMTFGLNATQLNDVVSFVCSAVYGYFYADTLAYKIDEDYIVEDFSTFLNRFAYDVNVKLPYWYRKYNYVKKLLTDADFSLMQTSKMTSSSDELTNTAGGSLQKTATTPTGVTIGGADDDITLTMTESATENDSTIGTTGFVDKYTNAQQKFANAGRVHGERSGEITREGSVDELINVLEKLPSSFADEISRVLQKHFIFDYDGEMLGIYDN